MVKTVVSFILLCLFIMPVGVALAGTDRVAAVVNEQAITIRDIDDRMKLIMASANLPATAEVRAKIRPQIIATLIDEAIRIEEAKRLDLKVEDAEIQAGIAQIAAQNKLTADQFLAMFKMRNIPARSLRQQIRAQLAWMKVVSREIRPQIEISESDIDAEMNTLKAKVGQSQYALSEILLPLDQAKGDQDAVALAQRLISEIRARPQSFAALAQQFSSAAGAAQGGALGWVATGQLEPEIEKALVTAKIGDLVGPIKTNTGLHILVLRDVRQISTDTLPSRDELANQIGMDRLERLQRRYFLDLKSSAFIDVRG